MNTARIGQPVAMRPSGVRARRIHREPTLLKRREAEAPAGSWSCACSYFQEHRFCAHTLHMECAARVG
jgi:hypothetical protein